MKTLKNMLVSIIVPVYNVEQYVENCLNSVVNQTYSGDIECIIVNDATLDNSFVIAQKFVGNYKGRVLFKLIEHTENLGLSESRNTGLSNASGDYVLFLDSDDELTPNCLESLVLPLNDYSYDFVLGSHSVKFSDKDVRDVVYQATALHSSVMIRRTYVQGVWGVTAWNKLCNRLFLINNNLFFKKGLIHEDDLWSFQLSNLANSMCIIPLCSYVYYARENSILATGRKDINIQIERKILLFKVLQDYVRSIPHYIEDNYLYIERKYVNILNDIYEHRGEASTKALYVKLRECYTLEVSLYGERFFLKIKRLLRDMHFLMPNLIGFYLWFFYRGIKTKIELR